MKKNKIRLLAGIIVLTIVFIGIYYKLYWLIILFIFTVFPVYFAFIHIARKNKTNKILFFILVLFSCISFLNFIKLFIFDVYEISSSSMENSLFKGDFVIVEKLSYGPQVSFLKHKNKDRLTGISNIKTNDVVVYKFPTNDFLYIKRCIGLPGDTLSIRDGDVYVNGKKIHEVSTIKHVYLSYKKNDSLTKEQGIFTRKEAIAFKNGNKEKIMKIKDFPLPCDEINTLHKNWTMNNFGPIVIPKKGDVIDLSKKKNILLNFIDAEHKVILEEDYYFVLGDNRHNSVDSRCWYFLPKSYIIGKTFNKIQ